MNRRLHIKLGKLLTSSMFTVALLLNSVYSDPGTLSDKPLFLGNTVQPNIFFGLDDSGSMGAAVIVNNGAVSTEGFAWIDALGGSRFRTPLYYAQEAANYIAVSNGGTPDSVLLIQSNDYDTPRKRRLTCVGYNTLAYDPTQEYTPWRGEDSLGNPYGNATLAAARTNPYNPGTTLDIRNFVYFEWTDADDDDEYDGPAATDPEAPNGPGDECGDVSSTSNGIRADNIVPDPMNLPFHSKTNFANWFVYYRTREFTAKRAVSELIFDSSHRMGLGTLHDNNNVGTAVSDMTVTANKDNLLEELSRVRGDGSTPTRGMYANIGRYFDKADTGSLTSGDAELGISNNSPILPANQGGTCQQNFAVVVSDGFWRNENEDSSGNDGFSGFGNEDRDTPTVSTFDGGSHEDDWSNTLADVAMHFYEKDLATGLADEVNTITGVDENTAQHLVGFMVAFGIDGTLTDDPIIRENPFTWPQPEENEPTSIDDMRHAAWNSRGAFLSAKDPQNLIDSLSDALAAIDARTATATAVTFNSNQLDAGTHVYLTQFNSENWSGELLAFDINSDGTLGAQAWAATDDLDDSSFNVATRTVYTYNNRREETPPQPADPIVFEWANLSDRHTDDLRTDSAGNKETASGFPAANARLNYIRGDRSEEIGASSPTYNFRARDSRLGDIVHSAPVFVGAPNGPYPDKDPFGSSTSNKRYSDFVEAKKNRKGIVYVGAGDGMVHGFDTTASGAEVMAYIPNALFDDSSANTGLHYLTNPNYTHKYYVDLSLAAGDAFITTSSGGLGTPSWTTVLVGGLRAGGKGVFALDVTDASFPNSDTGANSTVLWEFDDGDSAFVGFSYSNPRIVYLNNNKWAAILGNGYNSADGDAALLILYLEGGVDGTWSTSDYEIIETQSGDSGNVNGLGQVTVVDLNSDLIADRVYAGDIKGNLWAFDISSDNSNDWKVAYPSTGTPDPLFSTSTGRPITVKGAITRTETTTSANEPNVLVLLGSGQYLVTADTSNTDVQAFYGVWDAGTANLDENDLIEQDLIEASSDETVRVMDDVHPNYAATPSSGDFGWFYQLNDPNEMGDSFDSTNRGERVVIDPVVRGEQIFFATLIPGGDVCSDGGGSGWLMVLDAENGGEPTGGGIDLNNDGNFDSNDQISGKFVAGVKFTNGLPAGLGFLGGTDTLYISGTGGVGAGSITTQGIQALPDADIGRLSWQELVE